MPKSRKVQQRDAERPVAQRDLTPQRQRIEKDSASKGEIIGALHGPNSAMKLATGLDEMPGRRGIPEVNWADGVLSGSLLVRERNRGDKKKGGRAERG